MIAPARLRILCAHCGHGQGYHEPGGGTGYPPGCYHNVQGPQGPATARCTCRKFVSDTRGEDLLKECR